jgi:hypothetical protein
MQRTGSLKNRGYCPDLDQPLFNLSSNVATVVLRGTLLASLLITRFLLHTFSFLHTFNQAVWPHIGPIFIYELKASGTVVRFVYYGPAFGNIDEAWPQGMLAFSVYQNMIDAVFVVEWIRHFVLH